MNSKPLGACIGSVPTVSLKIHFILWWLCFIAKEDVVLHRGVIIVLVYGVVILNAYTHMSQYGISLLIVYALILLALLIYSWMRRTTWIGNFVFYMQTLYHCINFCSSMYQYSYGIHVLCILTIYEILFAREPRVTMSNLTSSIKCIAYIILKSWI